MLNFKNNYLENLARYGSHHLKSMGASPVNLSEKEVLGLGPGRPPVEAPRHPVHWSLFLSDLKTNNVTAMRSVGSLGVARLLS